MRIKRKVLEPVKRDGEEGKRLETYGYTGVYSQEFGEKEV